VALVKCGSTGQLLALKAISKNMLTRRRLERYPKNEKLAMQRCCSPFVVQLVATFCRERDLYLLMEAALGGNLFEAYVNCGLYSSEPHARFYIACVLLGLDHLHGRRILYRDLRMENVVLSSRGYGKLCDLGMALPLWSSLTRAYTVCGTPEYMAPEVASRSGYTRTADWWSLGVLLHELLTGRTPFAAGSPAEVFKKARAGVDVLGLPDGLSWVDLVRGLCKQAPSARLPALRGGIKNVQVHPWFGSSGFDWAAVVAGTVAAPFVPAALLGLQDLSAGSRPEEANVHMHVGAAPSGPASAWDRGFESTVGPVISPPSNLNGGRA
jgi:serine/threonine protein kinase